MVGTLKRECLNHMIIFNERHARRIIREFQITTMTGLTRALARKLPAGDRSNLRKSAAEKLSHPPGLHHRYYREAA